MGSVLQAEPEMKNWVQKAFGGDDFKNRSAGVWRVRQGKGKADKGFTAELVTIVGNRTFDSTEDSLRKCAECFRISQ